VLCHPAGQVVSVDDGDLKVEVVSVDLPQKVVMVKALNTHQLTHLTSLHLPGEAHMLPAGVMTCLHAPCALLRFWLAYACTCSVPHWLNLLAACRCAGAAHPHHWACCRGHALGGSQQGGLCQRALHHLSSRPAAGAAAAG
jgi:hypothetical protein